MIRVGRQKTLYGKPQNPEYSNFTPIVCLTKSSKYGSLGPYCIEINGKIFENYWQFSKIYTTVPYSKQRYSRFDPKVIWEHPAETHISLEGEPTEEYWNWRKKGFENPYPVRYPVGFHHRKNCVSALFEQNPGVFYWLDYIESRMFIYLSGYIDSVKKEPLFVSLQSRLKQGENLLIIEVDGPHQESLKYYQETYGVDDSFIENDTILCTKKNLDIMLNDIKHPFGHGYCLAWALLDLPKKHLQ